MGFRIGFLLAWALVAGCAGPGVEPEETQSADDAAQATGTVEAPATSTGPARNADLRPVLDALRAYVYAYYDLRLAPEDARDEARADLAAARSKLGLIAPVVLPQPDESKVEDDPEAAAETEAARQQVEARLTWLADRDLVFLPLGASSGPDPGMRLVEVEARRGGLAADLPVGKVKYRAIRFGRVQVEDFLTYSGKMPAGAFRPMYLGVGDKIIFFDGPLLERVGRESFYPKVPAYRRLEQRMAGGGALGADEAKDWFRWISLRDAGIAAKSDERAFADYYERQLEVLGAAILAMSESGLAPDEVMRRAFLCQVAAGDPRFAVADVLASAQGLGSEAAGQVILDLGKASGATSLAALAALTPEALRAAATQALGNLAAK